MQILLIRHGQSEADILQVHEGRADFPLTELGRKQVSQMAEKVAHEFPPELIFASPLKRARETAETLATKIGCSLYFEDDLMEHNNGVQAGLSFEEAEKLPQPTYLHDCFDNGESHIEFRMRIEMMFSKIVSSCHHNRIAIVAHGGVINCLLRAFFQMPISMDPYFKMEDTAMSLLEISENGRVVHFINNADHLR